MKELSVDSRLDFIMQSSLVALSMELCPLTCCFP